MKYASPFSEMLQAEAPPRKFVSANKLMDEVDRRSLMAVAERCVFDLPNVSDAKLASDGLEYRGFYIDPSAREWRRNLIEPDLLEQLLIQKRVDWVPAELMQNYSAQGRRQIELLLGKYGFGKTAENWQRVVEQPAKEDLGPNDWRQEALERYHAGELISVIAHKVGVAKQAVAKWIGQQVGQSFRTGKTSLAQAAIDAGVNMAVIGAEHLGGVQIGDFSVNHNAGEYKTLNVRGFAMGDVPMSEAVTQILEGVKPKFPGHNLVVKSTKITATQAGYKKVDVECYVVPEVDIKNPVAAGISAGSPVYLDKNGAICAQPIGEQPIGISLGDGKVGTSFAKNFWETKLALAEQKLLQELNPPAPKPPVAAPRKVIPPSSTGRKLCLD